MARTWWSAVRQISILLRWKRHRHRLGLLRSPINLQLWTGSRWQRTSPPWCLRRRPWRAIRIREIAVIRLWRQARRTGHETQRSPSYRFPLPVVVIAVHIANGLRNMVVHVADGDARFAAGAGLEAATQLALAARGLRRWCHLCCVLYAALLQASGREVGRGCAVPPVGEVKARKGYASRRGSRESGGRFAVGGFVSMLMRRRGRSDVIV